GPPGPRLIIGADIPGIRRRHIAAAFAALGPAQAVIGPASDGGYWLIGLDGVTPPPPTLFQATRWSTHDALADTLATLRDRRVALTHTLDDVDTATDLGR
ncbi:hypothetical protein LCGC14_1502350, partial [marine sediment metagenome]